MENINRRTVLFKAATGAAALSLLSVAPGGAAARAPAETVTFKRTHPPEWLLTMWKEIDDKTFGKGFECFREDAICNLGVADWHGREAIRKNLKAFIDTGFTAHHDVVEYWDGGPLKVFRGIVTMRPDDPGKSTVKPSMAHFFYMDKNDPTKVSRWIGAVGPVAF